MAGINLIKNLWLLIFVRIPLVTYLLMENLNLIKKKNDSKTNYSNIRGDNNDNNNNE